MKIRTPLSDTGREPSREAGLRGPRGGRISTVTVRSCARCDASSAGSPTGGDVDPGDSQFSPSCRKSLSRHCHVSDAASRAARHPEPATWPPTQAAWTAEHLPPDLRRRRLGDACSPSRDALVSARSCWPEPRLASLLQCRLEALRRTPVLLPHNRSEQRNRAPEFVRDASRVHGAEVQEARCGPGTAASSGRIARSFLASAVRGVPDSK